MIRTIRIPPEDKSFEWYTKVSPVPRHLFNPNSSPRTITRSKRGNGGDEVFSEVSNAKGWASLHRKKEIASTFGIASLTYSNPQCVLKVQPTRCISVTSSMCGELDNSTPCGPRRKFIDDGPPVTCAVDISREPCGPSKRINKSWSRRCAARVMDRILTLCKTCRIACRIVFETWPHKSRGFMDRKPTARSRGKSSSGQ